MTLLEHIMDALAEDCPHAKSLVRSVLSRTPVVSLSDSELRDLMKSRERQVDLFLKSLDDVQVELK